MTLLRFYQLLFSSVLLIPACGGKFESDSTNDGLDQDGGSEPDGTGGTDGAGGSRPGAGGASNGGASGSGAVGGCCLAAAVCNPGDAQINGPDECPPGAECYESAICCSSVWCVRQTANCEAYPSCDPGDHEIQGACPPAYACYTRAICGYEITCVDTGGAIDAGSPAPVVDGGASCDPDAEYNRQYVGLGDECALIDFICPLNTDYFGNECGCGCEQDSSCPEKVDCTGLDPGFNVLCQDGSLCPYSPRAF